MKSITIELFTFDELAPEVQKKVIEDNRHINTQYWNWWHIQEDEYTERLQKEGWSNIDFAFSGFSSQGDGASIEMSSEGVPACIAMPKAIEHARKDIDIIIKRSTRMHYVHDQMLGIEIETGLAPELEESIRKDLDTLEATALEYARNLSREYYKAIEAEYEYHTSDEAVLDTIRANEYTFEADGTMRNA